ncbi:MAG: ceramidase [Candidatus Berkelbacteria bacterium]|nr:ceramidase [Candidatus Berkelbacteria bacterium]MCR4307327.1 ceramidase [Candidatus Berkelbacteria bacterium]
MDIARAYRSCEAARISGLGQPVNSWSSLAFFGLATTYLISWTTRTQRFIQNSRLYSYLFILVVALIGIGSFLAHGTLTVWGGAVDFESMYLLVTLAMLLGLNWFYPIPQKLLLFIWLVVNVPLTYIAIQPARITDYTFMLLVFLVIIIELIALNRLKQLGNSYFWLSILSLAVGYGIWQLDVRKIWCSPYGLWQGHAVWHLLTALAACFLYIYLATKPNPRTAVGRDDL